MYWSDALFDGSDNSPRPVRIGNMTLYNDIAEVHTSTLPKGL